jgi:hypothetical protein
VQETFHRSIFGAGIVFIPLRVLNMFSLLVGKLADSSPTRCGFPQAAGKEIQARAFEF